MMMTLFVEHYGYYMDHELMAASAGYVRDSFVMASLDQISEYEHLEHILMDAVCTEPIIYDEQTLDSGGQSERTGKYQKYQKEKVCSAATPAARKIIIFCNKAARRIMRFAVYIFAYYRPTIFPKICFFPSSYRWITTMTVSPVLKSESS